MIFLIWFFVFTLIFLSYKRGYLGSLVTPVFYSITAVYSYVGIFIFDFAKLVPANLYNLTDDKYIYSAIFSLSLFSLIYLLGQQFFELIFGCRISGNSKESFTKIGEMFTKTFSQSAIICLSFLSPFLLVLSFDFFEVLSRDSYVSDNRSMIGMILARITLPLSCLFIAFINKSSIRWLSFVINYLVLFSITSRAMTFVPIFYVLGRFFLTGKIRVKDIVLATVLAIFSIAVSLGYRFNSHQGLIGNVEYLFSNGISLKAIYLGLNYVLSYSTVLFGNMIETVKYDDNLFFAAIMPLPSFIYDIGSIYNGAKLRANIPYSAVGEMFLYSKFVFYFIAFNLGFFFSFIEKFLRKNSTVLFIISFVFMVMFAFMSTQYQLRGAFRLVYYSSFMVVLLFIYMSLVRVCGKSKL